MKEVVWIFGNSAAGKETFIRHITDGDDPALLTKLGWANKQLAPCHASINYIGQFDEDPVIQKRAMILDEVPKLIAQADVVLIKWQAVDSMSGRIEELEALLPNVNHRIIQIITTDEELAKRLPQKSWWWEDGNTEEFISEERTKVANYITELHKKLPITQVSGDSDNNYLVRNP